MRTFLIAVSLCVALIDVRVALADDTEDARQAYDAGMQAYNAGQFKEAEELFTKGYELSNKPAFLWNMAESAAMAGDHERARDLYHRYLDSSPEGTMREETLHRLAELPPPPAASVETRRVDVDYSATKSDKKSKPIYKKWWFWTTGAVVIAGTATAIALTAGKKKGGTTGLGTLQGATFPAGEGNWK